MSVEVVNVNVYDILGENKALQMFKKQFVFFDGLIVGHNSS